MKKNKLLVTLSVLAVFACMVFLASCGGGANDGDAAKPVELKLAHFWPANHVIETDLIEPWAAEINEATDGLVTIVSYPGETLLKSSDIYDGVVSGIAEIGVSCFSYSPGRFPFCEVFELPGVTYLTSVSASKVAWEVIQEYAPEETQDTKLLFVLSTGPGDIYSKQPVRTLEDMKGLEIRATGNSIRTLEALGAAAVNLSQAEAYDAISKGVVKANLGPDEVLKGWNQADITQYITKTPFLYNTLFFVTMNSDAWNRLDEKTQNTIYDVSQKYYNEVALTLWDKQNEDALAWAQEEKGMEVIELPGDESARWLEALTPVQNDWVRSAESKGIDGASVLLRVKELAETYNKE